MLPFRRFGLPSAVVLLAISVLFVGGTLAFSWTRGAFHAETPIHSAISPGSVPLGTDSRTSPAIPVVTDPGAALPPVVPEDSAPVSSSVSLLFVGDIMLDRNVRLRSLKDGSRSYPFARLPNGWFDGFDYAVANLEGPVTDRRRPPEKSIDFLFDPEVVAALRETGIDAFSQANNHALDQGAEGYADSMRRLREAGFLAFGHQVQDGEVALATTTVKGVKFAFLGWNTTDNPLDRPAAERALAQAGATTDFQIAFLHWGQEYRDQPTADQIDTAHWLIDHGIDVVIGGHPHWVQGLSSYQGKPIAWSLGNFIFDQDFSLKTRQGLALALAFEPTSRGVSLAPFPVQVDQSQPRLVTADEPVELRERLEALAAISDPSLRADIRHGEVAFQL